ncbi:MAG: carbamoyltransferase HypF [Candidatus Omnitrophica bacterium]|nr:carbamoyltransferase HypF [Candidatus Omnitrophota bacterium]
MRDVDIIGSSVNFRKPVLAFGAELKNTFCLAFKKRLYIGKNFGNLENLKSFTKYQKGIISLIKRLHTKPKIIAYDLHPEYLSTKYAMEFARRYGIDQAVSVQHHHAHIASCMFGNNIKGKVIGVAFDGTGFGSDGNIWGGEFLVASLDNYRRAGHLKYIPMPGATKAILEPWRMAVSWLDNIYKDKTKTLGIDFTKRLNRPKFKIIKQMLEKNINSPLTSSMGRLFDAVASLVIARDKVNFEAQAAIELEELAFEAIDSRFAGYGFKIKNGDCLVVDPSQIFKEIIRDVKHGVSHAKIAYKFHCTVVKIIKDTCMVLRKKTNLNKIVLSGGVFQNRIISELALDLLRSEDFEVFTHKQIPINDAGISIGQAVVANAKFAKRG